MIITALYSQHEHLKTIERLLDALVSRRSYLALDFVSSLIHLWKSRSENNRVSGRVRREESSLLMYEVLATPLVSLLFYMMIATSTSQSVAYLDFARVGGLFPFCNVDATTNSVSSDEGSQALSFACCKAFEELYRVLDSQRQEQMINTLLSMMSDSFVQSHSIPKPTTAKSSSVPNLISTAYSACCVLLLLSENYSAHVIQRRSAILDRVMLLASKDPDDDTYMLFDMHAALLVALLQDNDNPNLVNGGGVSELLILCQKLLFACVTRAGNDGQNHRIICGIILSARLLRCYSISKFERKDIWNSVAKLLHHTSRTTSKEAARISNPKIGTWGIACLKFASSSLRCASDKDPSRIQSFIDTTSICGERDMFDVVNNMLAEAGVIQLENALKTPPQSENGKRDVFLAFNNVVVQRSLPRPKEMQAPRFVVCAPYFLARLQGKNVSMIEHGESINFIANYVYDLVDCYLQLGKSSEQGWNPRGWLLSKIQLPIFISLPESMLSLLGLDPNNEIELDSILGRSIVLKSSPYSVNKSHVKSVVMDIMNQNDRADSICGEILFVLKGIFTEFHRIMEAKLSTRRQTGYDKSRESIIPEIQFPPTKLKTIIVAVDTFLESRVCHISFSTLWNCLLEDNEPGDRQWEAILYEAAIDEGSSSSNEAHYAIHMRFDILWGLQQQYKSCTLDSNDTENTILSLRGIPRVYKTALALSSYTNKLDKSLSGSARQSIIEFVSCHFSLLLAAFSSYTKDLAVQLHVNDDIIASRKKKKVPTLESHSNDNNVSRLSDLITKCSHGSCTDDNVDVSSIDTVLEILKGQLLNELEKTKDYSMTCQLVDLLAMLTMHFDHNKACKCIVDATKEALGSVYSSSHANVDLPYLLFKIDHTVRNTNNSRLSIAKIPFSRLLQSANTLIKTKDSSTSAFIHHLLSHWSTLVICGSSQYRFLAETSQAVGDVIAFSCHTDSKQSDRRARISNQLPMLNKKMCIPVFELLMQMITASLSLAHPIRIRKVNQDPSQNESTPYDEIISLFVAFDKMLRLFRAHRLHFNQR
eukprot:scaffold18151_cov24-Cyclotella_meneghiniana.AAC.1